MDFSIVPISDLSVPKRANTDLIIVYSVKCRYHNNAVFCILVHSDLLVQRAAQKF